MHPFKILVENETYEAISPDLMADYVKFYALEFPATTHQAYPIEAAGERVVLQVFTPAEVTGVAVMCHGYYDHVGIYNHLLEYLLTRGRQVICFDQPGHGLSSGEPAHVESFEVYLAALRAVLVFCDEVLKLPGPDDWLGQSMGGAVLMEHFAHSPQPPRGEMVLFAPLVRPFAWWINRWVFAAAKHTITAKKRVLTRNSNDSTFLDKLARDPLQADTLPVSWVQAMVDWSTRFVGYTAASMSPRFIQGQMDHTIDWRYGMQVLKQRYPDADWLMLPTGRHHLVNESPELRATMFEWLDQWIDKKANRE